MSNEAPPPEHGDYPDLVQRYATDRARTAPGARSDTATPPTPAPQVSTPAKADEAPAQAPVVAPVAAPVVPAPATAHTVDEIKELERFRLGVWLVKVFVGAMMILLAGILGIYTWVAYTSKTLPDMGVLGTIFGHLKEVIVIIIDAQKS